MNISVQLIDSNLTIFNSAVSTKQSIDWVWCSPNSFVKGDLEEWQFSPQCQTQYEALRISENSSDITLIFSGNQEIVEVVLSEQDAGVNITLGMESLSTPRSTDSIQVYLIPVPCAQGLVVDSNAYNYLFVTIGQLGGNIGFVGPYPSYMRPNITGPSYYCLIINSTTSLMDGVLLSTTASFIKRNLTDSQVQLDPRVLFYSSLTSVNYTFFDQWGDPIEVLESLEISSSDCSNGLCGNTMTSSSFGEVFIRFNSTLKWQPYKRVVVLFPSSPPLTAYCNDSIYHSIYCCLFLIVV